MYPTIMPDFYVVRTRNFAGEPKRLTLRKYFAICNVTPAVQWQTAFASR